MIAQSYTVTAIAKAIDKHKSVVSRELKRNCDLRNGSYRHQLAQRKYQARQQSKPRAIKLTAPMREMVEEKLRQKLSPEQIVGICKAAGTPCISTERIYRHVWEDKRRKGKLYTHLRTQGKRYRKRGSGKDARGIIKDRVCIEQRPAIVEEKERFGDLEIDTIIGKNHKGAIVTINDRATGLLRMKQVERKEAELVKQAAIELLLYFKPHLHTITSDNGKEFALHQHISRELEVGFFFAHPYHSWERGANENLNGLIRQYIPKSSSFENLTDEYVRFVQEELNNRPRKRFDFKTPNQIFNHKVAFVT